MPWAKAGCELCYKPFSQPSGNMSQAHADPIGMRLGPCNLLRVLRGRASRIRRHRCSQVTPPAELPLIVLPSFAHTSISPVQRLSLVTVFDSSGTGVIS